MPRNAKTLSALRIRLSERYANDHGRALVRLTCTQDSPRTWLLEVFQARPEVSAATGLHGWERAPCLSDHGPKPDLIARQWFPFRH